MRFQSKGKAGKFNPPTAWNSLKTTAAAQLALNGAHDKNLHLPGRAELPLCPKFLGGAAAPPYRRREDFCPAPR
jgi:hypothetical protein